MQEQKVVICTGFNYPNPIEAVYFEAQRKDLAESGTTINSNPNLLSKVLSC